MRQLFITFLLIAFINASAQKIPSPIVPDIAAMQKMTPAQLEAYKQKLIKQSSQQAKTIANQYNLKLNEQLLPDYQIQPPPKDLQRLALIPKQPPTLLQLADGLRQTRKEIESVVPKAAIEEVQKIIEVQTPAEQQSSSIAAFYGDKPAQALLLAMHSALQNLQELTALNNLSAMLNMVKMEHKAVPILMNALQQDPNNSMLLNNMGQAYLAMGDLFNAEAFLKRCLAEDDMHPEANHSMGMLKFFQKEYEEGMKYFEKELEIAQRRSTLALLKKQGKKLNLYQLRAKSKRLPNKNYFEEINLGQFQIPDFPTRSDESRKVRMENESFGQSVSEEMLFWMNAANEYNAKEVKAEGERLPGIYHDLVKVMLEDFHGLFPSENLLLFDESDLARIKVMVEEYGRKMAEVKCPEPPIISNGQAGIIEAYQKKCCDLRKPITDAYMSEYNALVAERIAVVQPRWRQYIDGLVNIVSLDPGLANKKMVYQAVSLYFIFLHTAWGNGQFLDPPMECDTKMTTEQADEIIASSRNLEINCPQWLNFEIDLKAAKLKADCSKYAVEIGKGLQASYEKEFKTGKSTLSAGLGAKGKFWHLGKASAKGMLYISFDNNNEFADFGIKGQAGVTIGMESERLVVDEIGKIGTEIAGGEAGFTLGVSSGFNAYGKGKGIFAPYKISTGK